MVILQGSAYDLEDVGIILFSEYNHPNKWPQFPLEKVLGKIHAIHVEKPLRILLQGGPGSPTAVTQIMFLPSCLGIFTV